MSPAPVALVTAAGRGMGAAIAREFAARGYAVGLLARGEEAEKLAEELGGLFVRGSVAEPADLNRFVTAAAERFGRIDVVANNTGHAAKGDLLALSDAAWHEALDLLLLNVVRMARLAAPLMLAQGGGAFVNISSFAAKEPSLRHPLSAAMRAGLGAFASLFAARHGSAGLRMNNVLPGWIDTHPVAEADRAAIPAGRPGRAEEVAKAVAFLASADASYINGQSLLVDGGLVRCV